MEAFKCDRCGKYYDEYTVSNGYFKEVYVIFRKSDDTRLDICDECMHDLNNWFNDERKPRIKHSDENVTTSTFDPNKRIDISEGLDPKTGEWGHNS